MDELFAIAAAVVVAPIALLVGALVFGARKVVCPGCNQRALRVVGLRRMFVAGESSIERMYRCSACNQDFMRLDKGPLVPKRDWDAAGAAARAKLPPARLVDR
jgi:transposase-like protein